MIYIYIFNIYIYIHIYYFKNYTNTIYKNQKHLFLQINSTDLVEESNGSSGGLISFSKHKGNSTET